MNLSSCPDTLLRSFLTPVNLQASLCKSAEPWGCTFQYWNPHWGGRRNTLDGWSRHTPQLHSVMPKTVKTGTMVTVFGLFPEQPFNFDELKSPVNEVSVRERKHPSAQKIYPSREIGGHACRT